MSGEVTPVMIAALTVGLRVKKETIGEIAAAAQVMREFATRVEVPDRENLVDIVGTGGDASHTFNISTAAMFVAAAAGARVAKHGGRVGVVEIRQRRRAGGARRQHHAHARTGRAVDRRDRNRLHVRAVASQRDEARGAGAQGARRPDDLQHPRPAHQPGGRAESAPRRVPSGSRRHPGARAAAARQQARAGRLRQGRNGRGLARRGDDGRRAEGRRGPRVRDPPGGFRPADDVEPRPEGHRCRRIESDAARSARQRRGHAARDRHAERRRRAVRRRRRDVDRRGNRAGARRDCLGRRAGASSTRSSRSRRSSVRRPADPGRAMSDILARILATKAGEIAAAKRARPLARGRVRSTLDAAAARFRRRAARADRGRPPRGDRGDQEGEPQPRRAARAVRSRRRSRRATPPAARRACRC